jgi:hypothetical protein
MFVVTVFGEVCAERVLDAILPHEQPRRDPRLIELDVRAHSSLRTP